MINYGEDPGFLKPAPQGLEAPKLPALRLQVRAFPGKAVTTSSDQQTIYVLVQDQNLQPVARAEGSVIIRLPNGDTLPQNFVSNDNRRWNAEFCF